MIASIDHAELRDVLSLPAHLEILMVIALGKPGETIQLEGGSPDECPYWRDESNEFLAMLRHKTEHLTGRRCGNCRYRDVCAGCRIRAEVVHGDTWGDDPACFLTDEEIGLDG